MFGQLIKKFKKLNNLQKVMTVFFFGILSASVFLVYAIIPSSGRIAVEGTMVKVLNTGEGRALAEGDTAVIDYSAFLEDGTEFDGQSSFVFKLNDGSVLEAWSKGVIGMKVGEIRRLTVRPEFAYGERGIPGIVPPNSTVIFEIKLVEIR